MVIEKASDGVIIKDIKSFNIFHTFDCGQCFRFELEADKSYTGVAFGKVLNVSQSDDNIYFKNTSLDDFNKIWADYFDIKRDYCKIKSSISKDKIINCAVNFGFGIRILKQDIWECIISFIISQRNSIPKIKKVISLFCEKYGDEIIFNNKKYYSFPSVDMLINLKKADLAFLKCGYRDEYIIDAIKKVYNKEIDFEKIKNAPIMEAKNELKKVKGIGDKVADCILLFSAQRFEAFPVDTWIKKVMQDRYNISDSEISSFTENYFGDNCGFAQQYLFYCEREKGFLA